MKRKWKIAITALCATVALTAVYAAAAGSQDDPLITLSYLKNIFTPQVQTMVDDAVAANTEQNQADLEAAIQAWDEKVSQAVEDAQNSSQAGESASFASVSLASGKTVSLQAGCEIIVRSGSPVCSGPLIDQTSGSVLAAGSAMTANHLYLASDACTVSVPSAAVTGTVNAGPLNVRAGAGSSYSILGTLQEGAVVTIVSDSGNGWYQITGGGLAGYVSASYVDLNPTTSSGSAGLMLRGTYTVK